MKVKFQDHFDPAYECIHLLTRHFAPPEGLHSTQDVVNLFAEKKWCPTLRADPTHRSCTACRGLHFAKS